MPTYLRFALLLAVLNGLSAASIQLTRLDLRGPTSIYAEWLTTIGGSDVFVHFVEYRELPNGDWKRGKNSSGADQNSTSHTVVGLKAATPYEFRVGNANQPGVFSATVPITMPAADIIFLTQSAVNTNNARPDSLEVSWANNGTSAQEVVIEYRAADQTSYTASAATAFSALKASVSGLQADTLYYLRARTRDASQSWSGYSNTIIARTRPQPGLVKAFAHLEIQSLSQTSVDLRWQNNFSDPYYSFSGNYIQIERKIGSAGTWQALGSSPADMVSKFLSRVTVNSLSAGTEYYFRLRGVQYDLKKQQITSSTTDYSEEIAVNTPATGVPAQPGNFVAMLSGPQQVALLWTMSGLEADSFLVQRQENGVWTTIAGISGASARTFTDSQVSPGQLYAYRVQASLGGVSGAFTEAMQVAVPPQGPITQRNLRIVVGPGLTVSSTLSPEDAVAEQVGDALVYAGLQVHTDYRITFLSNNNG